MSRCAAAFLLLWACAVSARADEPAAGAKVPQFERDVAPLLKTYCWRCHGGEALVAGLDLRTVPLMLAGGQSGPAIRRGSAEESLLYRQLASGKMPPENLLKPTSAHLATIKAWLDAGAPAAYEGGGLAASESPPLTEDDRNWWAFRAPIRRDPPAVRQADQVRNPIDAFLLAALEAKGLSFAPPADRATLLRRVSLDLVGLPPTADDLQAWMSDRADDAYERLVNRLLDSPHYGERWGRHWLDAAGYVDTIGADNDAGTINLREGIWQYRDYVVRAFNADKPYDRFLLEQIAGDELVDWRGAPTFTPQIQELLIATGFLRNAADDTNAPELNTADIRHRVLFDTLQTLSSNVLGLTLHCAQCHSHKFDPVSQADYFKVAAVFQPAYNPRNWKHSGERFLPDVSAAERQAIDAHNQEMDRQIAQSREEIAGIRRPFEMALFLAKLAHLPEPIRADTQTALETPAEKRTEIQKYLAEKFAAQLAVKPEEVEAALDQAARHEIALRNDRVGKLQASKKTYGKLQALWDVAAPSAAYLYRRGSYETPGAPLQAGVPQVLELPGAPFQAAQAAGGSSGYRLAFARWLIDPRHPLVARVIVNRVWQQYFGRGIVPTPDNFGRSGISPSHPELLDWLALEFINRGWKFKELHRLIVTSTAYRQATRVEEVVAQRGMAADPDNQLWWKMPLRRLESEIIRDCVLAVSGQLDRTLGGPPLPIKSLPEGMVVVDREKLPGGATPFRRSLYLTSRRNYHPTELDVFDQPLVATNCTRRHSSSVALQSLTMLNGPFVMEQAESFAARVIAQAGNDPARRVELAFVLALGRPPSTEETRWSIELLSRQLERYAKDRPPEKASAAALASFCQMLLNTNEFLYVP